MVRSHPRSPEIFMETEPRLTKNLNIEDIENKEKLSLRVLLAEDNNVLRENVEENLINMGYIVDAVENGQLLLDQLIIEDYDLVITDHNMPIVKGLQALQKIRSTEKTKDLPVIVFSGGEWIKNAVEESGGIYCDKSDPDLLFTTVTKLFKSENKST